MKLFDNLPKSIKKTIRYIHQDVSSIEKFEEIERQLIYTLEKKRRELEEQHDFNKTY
ncbi:hypothetical protein JCM9152_2816 [Halalkalibacter hemicellulosilyticusJCM 9152]|uniref:LytR family transcriptional regulator n=1 Tax=Halalkalibacter hemicellulosilyticusJCM 9152 TaxID=1236971 RepID=W4QGX1_9BACI|nr:hypothetical protein JCM9152_2816 [Halalkalibacter hemicellulosilyticusJCM 9152]